ncbi:MAG: tetratricopeptide repeat protein [Deltaproteobacteria bacterium]|nr:MAG: tetratricopeptide repeat protein [Deltaproteobacteria bacterium]
MRRLSLFLVLMACQPSIYKSAQTLSAAGNYLEATDLLLPASAQGDRRARELLPEIAQSAYRMELDRAHEAEAADDLPASLDSYDRLLALETRVKQARGPSLPPHVHSERKDVAKRTAVFYFKRGKIAFEDGRTHDALQHWQRADRIDSEASEAHLKIPMALTTLGDEAREAHRYREALARYEEAVQLGGGDRAAGWAASIHAAYGRYALRKGACRRAVEELTIASAMPFDVRLARDLDRARECAVREVVVHPFTDRVEGGIDDPNLATQLVDQIAHYVRTNGSTYIRLIDPESPNAQTKVTRDRQRIDVEGHLSRLRIEQPEPQTSSRTAPGRILVPCSAGGEPRCEEELTVAFELTETRLRVDLAGSLKVVDRHSGEQLTLRPLDMHLDKVRRQANPTRITDLRGFVIEADIARTTSPTSTRVAMAEDILPWFGDPEPLPDPVSVLDEAVVRLAAAAADAVLATVDQEPELPEPETLHLFPPITTADEITFGDAPLRHEARDDPAAPTDVETPEDPLDEPAQELDEADGEGPLFSEEEP